MHDYEHSGVFPMPGIGSLATSVTVSLLSRIDPTQAPAGRDAESHMRWCVRAAKAKGSVLSWASAQLIPKATHAVAALTKGAFASALSYVADRRALPDAAQPKRLTAGENCVKPRTLVVIDGMHAGSLGRSREEDWWGDESA